MSPVQPSPLLTCWAPEVQEDLKGLGSKPPWIRLLAGPWFPVCSFPLPQLQWWGWLAWMLTFYLLLQLPFYECVYVFSVRIFLKFSWNPSFDNKSIINNLWPELMYLKCWKWLQMTLFCSNCICLSLCLHPKISSQFLPERQCTSYSGSGNHVVVLFHLIFFLFPNWFSYTCQTLLKYCNLFCRIPGCVLTSDCFPRSHSI